MKTEFKNHSIGDLQVGLYELPADDYVYIVAISDNCKENRRTIEWGYCDEHGNLRGYTVKGSYYAEEGFLYGRPKPYVIEELPV